MKRKFVVLLVSAIFLLTFVSFISGCSAPANEDIKTVGVFFPCRSPERWIIEGEEIKNILEANGYNVDLFYAQKDSDLQVQQIKNSICQGVDAMIIAAVSPDDLTDTLNSAYDKDIKIIAYNALLTNTNAVNYYVAFDNKLIGIQQAESLVEGMRAKGDGPYNIEIFTECENAHNFNCYYTGAMSVIQPLVENGEINIGSGEISHEYVCIDNLCINTASERFNNLLDNHYSYGNYLDGILSPVDIISLEFIKILDDRGEYSSIPYPIITGQDADPANIKAIVDSKQYSTIFKDSKMLAQIASSMVTSVLNGEEPEINDDATFYNGVKIVPAFLCEPILITKDNYRAILIDSGYYDESDIFLNRKEE